MQLSPEREAVRRLFAERDELPLEARASIVEAMSRFEGVGAGVVARELSEFAEGSEGVGAERAVALRLALFGAERGEVSPGIALGLADAAVRSDPSDCHARISLARALRVSGDDEEALAQLSAATEHEATLLGGRSVQLELGALHYNLGHYRDAAAYYRSASELRPTATSDLFLADALRMLGEDEEASRYYVSALRRRPDYVDALRGFRTLSESAGHGSRSWLGGVRRTVESMAFEDAGRPGVVRARLVSWSLRRSSVRRVARWLLSMRLRRHPEQAEIQFVLGLLSMLERDFSAGAELLSFASAIDPQGDRVAAAFAVLCERLEDGPNVEWQRSTILSAGADPTLPDGRGRRLEGESLTALLALPFGLEPRLGSPAQVVPDLVLQISAKALFLDYVLPLPSWPSAELARVWSLSSTDLRVDFDEQAAALVAEGPIRVGQSHPTEIRLAVTSRRLPAPGRRAKIAIYVSGDALNVRWIGGDRLVLLNGESLGPGYTTISVGVEEAQLPLGIDVREALAGVLAWD